MQDLHAEGDGVPDLLVGYRGVICLVEAKGRSSSLTPSQETFHRRWAGYPVVVARTPEEAWALVRRCCGEVSRGPQQPAWEVEVPFGKGTCLTAKQLMGGPVLVVPTGKRGRASAVAKRAKK